MQQFTGTLRLLRLALRRDRVRLGIWLVIIIGLTASVPPAVQEMYSEPGMREQYAATMTDSMVGRLYGGLLDGDSIGAVVMVESFTFTAMLIAFMSALLVVRHTRANEETGAAEALHATQLGRLAPMAAALLLACVVNASIALATGLLFLPYGEYQAGSGWLLGVAFMGVGMSFAALGALAAQISSSARGANALAGGVIGLSFVLRGIGDAYASRGEAGQLESHWLSWLSPLGWGQQIYPFTRQEVWVLGLFVLFVAGITSMSMLVARRRDIGSGLLGERKGPARANALLKTYIGFAWRLHKITTISWIVVMALLGGLYGSMVQEFKEMLSSSDFMKQYIAALGGEGEAVQVFINAMITITAVVITGYLVSGILRMKAEETSGRLESVFATATYQTTWMMSHVAVLMSGVAVMLLVLGVSTAVATGVSTGEGLQTSIVLQDMIKSLAFIAPLYVCLAAILLVYGIAPRLTNVFAWALFLFVVLISQLAALLKIPTWIQNASPFYHVPADSVSDFALSTCVVMILMSSTALMVALFAFRHRDIGR